MLTHNITTKVHPDIHEKWTAFHLGVRLPTLRTLAFINDVKLFHLLNQNEDEGMTYVMQIYFTGPSEYETFLKLLPQLRLEENTLWPDRFVSFETVMETVH